jgi:4-hydroxybenzoate polyprenyltransferase
MVKAMGYIPAFSRLIRLPNLLIVAATQILIRFCVIKPLLSQGNMELQLSGGLFAMLVVATVLTTAAGYVINDYFDRKIDRINKPGSVVVGKIIYPRHAMAFHLFFSISGAMLGTWVSYRANVLYLSLIFFIVSGLLWFYSTTYKREFLLGNFLVALMTAFVPFMVLLYELPLLAHQYGNQVIGVVHYLLIWVLGFALFAFLLNLSREFIKDAGDYEGDKAFGKRTIPVVWGMAATRWITSFLLAVTALLLVIAWYFFIPDAITIAYFLVMLIIPLILVIAIILGNRSANSLHTASTILKFVMIAGLIYMIAVNIIINRLS